MTAAAINLEAGRHAMELAKSKWGTKPLAAHLQSLMVADQESCSVAGDWFVATTEPRQADLAKGELAQRGVVPYIPRVPKTERHGRGSTRTVWRPMFGTYIFVRCLADPDHWRLITSARGIRKLLGINDKPRAVEPGRIDAIRLYEAEKADLYSALARARAGGRSGIVWHFSVGDQVKIKEGPFAGFYAALESAVDEHDRIRALVSIFGRATRTELSAFEIEAI